ncbi:MAG: baseplate J/gp47 family protein [Chloroflexi bacterium]|nr:baseplate J/gp47 family protein [Chloroflexota bacterium]
MSRLVQLDIHDDIAAIRGHLDAVPDTVAILVAPTGTQALRNPVYLRLLRHHAEAQGKDVALVTHDHQTQTLAREAGLRVFSSVRSATSALGKTVEGQAVLAPPSSGERLREWVQALAPWTVMTLVLSSLVTGAVIFLPHATIRLVPAAEVVDEALAVTASSALLFPSAAELRVPARVIEIPLTTTGQAEGNGTRKEPDSPARGKVLLTNRTTERVEVPQGATVVSDNGVEFTTVGQVVVSPSPDGRAEIGIVAAQRGPVGNVGTGAITRFADADLNRRLEVRNTSPTSGGTTKDGAYVTVDDRANLRQKLLEQLKTDAQAQILTRRKEGESIYPQTIVVRAHKETFEELSPANEGGKPRVNLTLEGVARGLAFNEATVKETIIQHLESRSEGKYTLAADRLDLEPLEAYQWNDEEVSFHLAVRTLALPKLDEGVLEAAVAGRSREESQTILAQMVPLAGRPTVDLWPFWATRIPRFPWRIDVAVTVE